VFKKPGCCARAFFMRGVFGRCVCGLRRDGRVDLQVGRSRRTWRDAMEFLSARSGSGLAAEGFQKRVKFQKRVTVRWRMSSGAVLAGDRASR